jgi:hypothetical protein
VPYISNSHIFKGLSVLQKAGVTHHDMKAANVLVKVLDEGTDTRPPALCVALSDLGSAGVCEPADTLINNTAE